MIKALIFDFVGVLVRTEDYSLRHTWDERLGLPPGSVERAVHHSDIWIQAQLGRITPRAYWNGVAELLYMSKEDIDALCRDYFSGDRVNHKVVALIRDLREKGYRVALLSNNSLQLTSRLRDLGLEDLFDHVLISAQMGMMKPDPTAYRVALQTCGVGPGEAILVDESLTNIRGAQPLGIHTIVFRPDLDLKAEINKCIEGQQE
ncbi:MAG: HAD family phosphatase [Chloroflexi bacterium]|nr:MAG: HAD family phosphatase [Chloroflexota bacterium]